MGKYQLPRSVILANGKRSGWHILTIPGNKRYALITKAAWNGVGWGGSLEWGGWGGRFRSCRGCVLHAGDVSAYVHVRFLTTTLTNLVVYFPYLDSLAHYNVKY